MNRCVGIVGLELSHLPTSPETFLPLMPAAAPPVRLRLAAALCAVAALFAAGVGLAAEGGTNAKIKQSNDELGRVRARIEEAAKQIERDRSHQSSERGAVESAEKKIAEAQAQLRRVSAEVEAQEGKVRSAQAGRVAAEQRLAREKDLLARQLRAAYVIGESGRTELLFSQNDPDRIDRLLTYFDYMGHASTAHIGRINDEIAAVQQQQQQYEVELKSLHELQAQHKRALVELQSDRDTRAKAVAALEAQIAGETQTLKQLQDSEKQLQNLLQQLHNSLADTPVRPSGPQKAFPEMRGKLSWPLRGELLARFGDAKADNRLQWKGLWIGAQEGSAVHASAHGRVAYVGWLSSYGLIVVLEHEKGFFTLYGHNATISKAAGDIVSGGDVIATVGNTGGYEQPGLYFEVRKGTESLNPTDWLAR